MNLVDNPYALRSGEAQRALDVDIGLRDVLSNRHGYIPLPGVSEVLTVTKSPGTCTSVEEPPPPAGEGNPRPAKKPWINPNNAKASDNTSTTVSITAPVSSPYIAESAYIKLSNFGNALPGTAVITGIAVFVEAKELKALAASGNIQLQLVKAGVPVGSSRSLQPTGTEEVLISGGPGDVWGVPWVVGDMNNAGFGVWLFSRVIGGVGQPAEFLIDQVTIKVEYYIPATTDVTNHSRPWYSGANRLQVLSQNGKLRSLNSSAGTLTLLFTGTAGTTWGIEQMEYSAPVKDSLWMMNGTDVAKKWDGTTFANWAGKPPKGNMLRVWKNMMIVSGVAAFPQRVFFSDVGNPESPEDETNGGYGDRWIDIRTSEDDLDPVTWLEVLDDVLLVFKKKSVNAIYDPSTFSFQRIANVGCENRFQSCVVEDRAYFVNRGGVYSVTAQGALRYESLNIEPMFKGTGPPGLEGIDLNLLASSGRMSALPNGRVYLACTPKGSLANKWLLEAYPRLRGALGREDPRTPWVKHSFSKRLITSLATYRAKDEEVDKIIAGLTDVAGKNAELVRLFEGTKDGAEPIEWLWRSGFKSLISEEPFERIRRVNLLMRGKLTARMLGGSVGNDFELESNEEELKEFAPESRGRYHALELRETGVTDTSIYKGEFVLRGGKEH